MSNQHTPQTVSLNLTIPYELDQKKFLNKAKSEADKVARRLWHEISGIPKKKGGRPSKKDLVLDTCEEIWENWKTRRVSKRLQTKDRLLKEVGKRIGNINEKTLNKHVNWWFQTLPPDELPKRMQIELYRDGNFLLGQIKTRLFAKRMKYTLKHLPKGGKLRDLDKNLKGIDSSTRQKIEEEFQGDPEVQQGHWFLRHFPPILEAAKTDPIMKKRFYHALSEFVQAGFPSET